MTTASNFNVELESRAEAVFLRLDRPPVNAFTFEMFGQLQRVLQDLELERRPLIISGSGGIFSAGMDTKHSGASEEELDAAACQCLQMVRNHHAPVIAAVERAAVGFGLLLATSADFLVVSKTASLRMPEVQLGMEADPRPLRRFFSEPWVWRVCMTGESVTAEEMHLESLGAFICDPEQTEIGAAALAARLAAIAPDSLRAMKSLLRVSQSP